MPSICWYVAMAGAPSAVEEDGDRGGAALVEADVARPLLVRVQPQVRQPVEQGADAGDHLGPGDVHAQADVRAAAEGEHRPGRAADVELVGPLPAGGVAVG